MGQDNAVTPRSDLNSAARSVKEALASFRVDGGQAHFRTPFLSPSGATIPIVMHPDDDNGWMVHDDGFGALEAELTGGLHAYRQVARAIADREGLHFDQRMIFCASVPEDWLANAVIMLGSAVRQALVRTAERQAMASYDLSRRVLFEKLEIGFGRDRLVRDAELSGRAGSTWKVDALVSVPGRWRAVYDVVTPNANSVASSFIKLTDIGQVDDAPLRIAVKQRGAAFEAPQITLLSQAASVVVDLDQSVESWMRLAA
ncbi:hypothetical protein [Ancylobacter sp. SL191]|uniref:hypothetical protein n=1 Tax=Ancylobacter sp. SL191 TaxID=2995166 RepID=UPI0022714E0A|nr:hypothetical protein [Ancylobacter sp. SL191]WAC26277.1 hypothetical protein OU996_14815 [Ancylobacter sp. SL191]